MIKKQWYELLFDNYGQKYDNENFAQGTIGECDFIENELRHDKSLVPDLLVLLIPLVTGIILLIMDFNFLLLFAVLLLIFLTTSGNGFIRGKLTCRYCKQGEMGCPAQKLFS